MLDLGFASSIIRKVGVLLTDGVFLIVNGHDIWDASMVLEPPLLNGNTSAYNEHHELRDDTLDGSDRHLNVMKEPFRHGLNLSNDRGLLYAVSLERRS